MPGWGICIYMSVKGKLHLITNNRMFTERKPEIFGCIWVKKNQDFFSCLYVIVFFSVRSDRYRLLCQYVHHQVCIYVHNYMSVSDMTFWSLKAYRSSEHLFEHRSRPTKTRSSSGSQNKTSIGRTEEHDNTKNKVNYKVGSQE